MKEIVIAWKDRLDYSFSGDEFLYRIKIGRLQVLFQFSCPIFVHTNSVRIPFQKTMTMKYVSVRRSGKNI